MAFIRLTAINLSLKSETREFFRKYVYPPKLQTSTVMYIQDKILLLSIMAMFLIDYRDYVSNIKTKTERGIGHSD
jgi:hypothetical protein